VHEEQPARAFDEPELGDGHRRGLGDALVAQHRAPAEAGEGPSQQRPREQLARHLRQGGHAKDDVRVPVRRQCVQLLSQADELCHGERLGAVRPLPLRRGTPARLRARNGGRPLFLPVCGHSWQEHRQDAPVGVAVAARLRHSLLRWLQRRALAHRCSGALEGGAPGQVGPVHEWHCSVVERRHEDAVHVQGAGRLEDLRAGG